MLICVVLGTRPEIIKLSPVIRALAKQQNIRFSILHTGQHYSLKMDRIFFEMLKLPDPEFNLEVGSGSHGEQTAKMLIGLERILTDEHPELILVQGDTNTVLAAALAAAKLHIKIGHVEAGLRSFNRIMPEEVNRLLTDHLSDYLFSPTRTSRANLLREGIADNKIFVTGNTIVDAIQENLELAHRSGIQLGIDSKSYFVATIHREENVDNPIKLASILRCLSVLSTKLDRKVIIPMHPRTRKQCERNNIKISERMLVTDPLDYFSFLKLESEADLILTDSGGVQEEACILHVPCVTLRNETERPETVEVGANIVAGIDSEKVIQSALSIIDKERTWLNPFGDGQSSTRIVDIILSNRSPNDV